MAHTIVFLLPEHPQPGDYDTHWWRVLDGAVAESGADSGWFDFVAAASGDDPAQVALAPAASVRLQISAKAEGVSTDRQALAVASAAALESSLGEAGELHSASRVAGDRILTAIVDASAMTDWLSWAAEAGCDPARIVPVAALLPLEGDWTEATFGSERVIGRTGLVMAFEPGLTDSIVGDAQPRVLDEAEVEALIAAAAADPPLNLRSGRFARRPRLVLDRARLRELAVLAAAIPVLMLLWGIIAIAKLNHSTAVLDRDSVAIAQRVLGRPVTIDSAEAALSERAGAVAQGGLMAPLTELYNVLQPQQSVSATDLSYSSDGTLSVTLAAPTMESISAAVVALQRDGYKITAVTRQSPDGRAMVDTTIRSRP